MLRALDITFDRSACLFCSQAGVMATLDYSAEHFGEDFKNSYLAAPKQVWRTEVNDSNLAGYARCTYVVPKIASTSAMTRLHMYRA